MVPRGSVVGCHMAPLHWLVVENFMGSTGVEPVTFEHGEWFWQGQDISPPTLFLVI
jgi:hypothetical protein